MIIGFLLSPVGRWLAGLAVALLLVGGIYIKGRADGGAVVAARYERAIAAEKVRQAEANAKAKKEGEAIVADLEEKNRDLTELLVENAEAAARDPDAGRPAISSGGVLRLNKIR